MTDKVEIISINKDNIDQEHICCALGNDKKNKSRAQAKKSWMKDRFEDGLVFKRLDHTGYGTLALATGCSSPGRNCLCGLTKI